MGLSTNRRQEIIDDLTTNCECWSHQGDDEVLGNFTDEKLIQLKKVADREQQAIAVANAAINGFTDNNGNAYRVNPETGNWEHRRVENAKKKVTVQEDDEDEEDDEEEEEIPSKKRMKKMMGNSRGEMEEETPPVKKPRTREQLINSLPADMRESLKIAEEVTQREKDRVIGQILANSGVSDVDKRAHNEWLQSKSVDELRNTLSLMPKPPATEPGESKQTKQTTNRKRFNSGNSPETEDMLVAPVINWEPVEEKNGNGYAHNATIQNDSTNGSDYESDEPSYDELMGKLPPSYRTIVQNAVAVDARERRRLIDELTVNVEDDEAEKRLRTRLERKSVEELKDLVALTPKKEAPRPSNYFGSSVPLTSNTGSDAGDDLLLPPSMDWKEQR